MTHPDLLPTPARPRCPDVWIVSIAARRPRAALALLLALAGVSACSGDEPHVRSSPDVGRFCVTSIDGGRITFAVSVGPTDPCLDACHGHELSCRATLTGTRIELTSRLESRELPGITECPAACFGSTASCELENVPAGDYQLGFASRFDTATLPLDGSIPLFGDHDCAASGPLLPNPYPSPPARTERVPEFEHAAE